MKHFLNNGGKCGCTDTPLRTISRIVVRFPTIWVRGKKHAENHTPWPDTYWGAEVELTSDYVLIHYASGSIIAYPVGSVESVHSGKVQMHKKEEAD